MMYEKEIAIKDMNWERASAVAQSLVEEGYAVMLTLEENLIIIDYEYACDRHDGQADRNNMVFMSRDAYEIEREELFNEITNGS